VPLPFWDLWGCLTLMVPQGSFLVGTLWGDSAPKISLYLCPQVMGCTLWNISVGQHGCTAWTPCVSAELAVCRNCHSSLLVPARAVAGDAHGQTWATVEALWEALHRGVASLKTLPLEVLACLRGLWNAFEFGTTLPVSWRVEPGFFLSTLTSLAKSCLVIPLTFSKLAFFSLHG
jgi:hypothetical protein